MNYFKSQCMKISTQDKMSNTCYSCAAAIHCINSVKGALVKSAISYRTRLDSVKNVNKF